MTRISCSGCRLRFTRAAAAHLTACPSCGGPLHPVTAEQAFGLRLFSDDGHSQTLPEALAAMLPVPPTEGRPS